MAQMGRKPSFPACRSRFREVVSSGITRETWLKPFSPIPEEARKQSRPSLMNISFRADRDSHGKEKADSGYGFDRGGYCDLGVGDVGRATATSAIWR
jgi:hypothetical protein